VLDSSIHSNWIYPHTVSTKNEDGRMMYFCSSLLLYSLLGTILRTDPHAMPYWLQFTVRTGSMLPPLSSFPLFVVRVSSEFRSGVRWRVDRRHILLRNIHHFPFNRHDNRPVLLWPKKFGSAESICHLSRNTKGQILPILVTGGVRPDDTKSFTLYTEYIILRMEGLTPNDVVGECVRFNATSRHPSPV